LPAKTICFEEMLRATTVIEQQCAVRPDTVWVIPFGRGICMRYCFSHLFLVFLALNRSREAALAASAHAIQVAHLRSSRRRGRLLSQG